MNYIASIPLCLFLILGAVDGQGQVIYPPGYVGVNVQSGGIVVPVNYVSKSSGEQEQYVSDRWNEGTIVLLNNDSIHGYPLKYNLSAEMVEVKTKSAVKVVPLNNILRFYWVEDGQPNEFINGGGYAMAGTPLVGHLQLLSEGKLNLFKKTFLSVQKANYRPELDVGSREDKVVREDVYYVARGKNLVKIKPRKIFSFFKKYQQEVKQYAKQNHLSPREEEDLIRIVDYYNQLIS